MTPEAIPGHDQPTPRSWPQIKARLTAVVGLTSSLGYRYKSLEFEDPTVLNRAATVNRRTIRWSTTDGTELWLREDHQAQTIGIRVANPEAVGTLIFWAIVDPLNQDKPRSGFAVLRSKGRNAVAKIIRHNRVEMTDHAICVVSLAKVTGEADSQLLSSLATGFSDAASDQDRDAWSSWLWQQVSVGRISQSYAKALGSKILGPRARRPEPTDGSHHSADILTVLADSGVFERGADYILPSGLHGAVHINLGKACGSVEVLRFLAERVNSILGDIDYNTVVSTGWPVAAIARRMIRLRPMTGAGVIRHCEYEGVPPFPLTPVGKGSDVVVLTDVRVTGGLIAQVVQSTEAAGGIVRAAIAIVDAGAEPESLGGLFRSVCRYDVQAVSPTACPRCDVLERREFNPVACCMTFKKKTPRSPGEFLGQNPEAAEFWKLVDAARAYEHHRVEGHTHYLAFIDTERLLTHETIGQSIVGKLAAQLPAVVGVPDVILVPSRARAHLLAEKMLRIIASGDRLWPPDIISATQLDDRFRVSSKESALMRGAKVLIADTGITHGATLDELQELAVRAEAHTVGAVALISRMSDVQELALVRRFGGRFRRLYQVPIRPLSIPDSLRNLCPVCRRRDDLHRAAAESNLRPIVELSAVVRARRARRGHSLAKPKPEARATQIRLMARDDVPFLTSCRRGTASGVTLHSLHAAMNDGMAPLKLPEMFDEGIPASSRTAILEHLENSALQWSGEALVQDAMKLLESRDPDETWGACAGLLNRASRFDWVDALERRLLSSKAARDQGSIWVWNRIAFEVFSLLKEEPSFQGDLSTRFRALRLSCANTPAEQGLARIQDVIDNVDVISRHVADDL